MMGQQHHQPEREATVPRTEGAETRSTDVITMGNNNSMIGIGNWNPGKLTRDEAIPGP